MDAATAEPAPYFTALARRALGSIVERHRRAGLAEGLPGPTDVGPDRQDLGLVLQRTRLEARHGQQLADHPRQPVGLLGDDREAAVGPVVRELLGVRPDARERRLEVVAHAPQEVVLRRVELEELGVLRIHSLEQLGVPDRHRDLRGEQVEEVLIGCLPRARRRQPSDDEAQGFLADP